MKQPSIEEFALICPEIGGTGASEGEAPIESIIYGEKQIADALRKFNGYTGMGTHIPILIDCRGLCMINSMSIGFRFHGEKTGLERVLVAVRRRGETDYHTVYINQNIEETDTVSFEFPVNSEADLIKIRICKRQEAKCPFPQIRLFGEREEPIRTSAEAEEMRFELLKLPHLVDRYGQYLYEEWEGKVKTDDDLLHSALREKTYLEKRKADSGKDEYGGIIGNVNYGATGYFRTQKIDGVWWFITPSGNRFIIKGVEAVSLTGGPGLSRLYYKDTKIKRSVYQELPDPEVYPQAYQPLADENTIGVNLLIANLIRKYGSDYEKIWAVKCSERLKKWNFNTHSKWVKSPDIVMPYICSLNATKEFLRIKWAIDPFDPEFEQKVERAVAPTLTALRNDRLLIGYHFTNESGWNKDVVATLLKNDSTSPAKKTFADYMIEKYNGDYAVLSQKFGLPLTAADFADAALDISCLSKQEVSEFILIAAKKYYKTVHDVLKKYDPNHLDIGSCVSASEWRNSFEWVSGSADYVDVISFDRYILDDAKHLLPYQVFDKPFVNLEWSFTVKEHGYLGGSLGRILCNTQTDRAYYYKRQIEAMFSLPQFIGSGWFIFYDQPVTGRSLGGENAENYNFGLVNMQDEPYYEFVDSITRVNAGLEEIHEKCSKVRED